MGARALTEVMGLFPEECQIRVILECLQRLIALARYAEAELILNAVGKLGEFPELKVGAGPLGVQAAIRERRSDEAAARYEALSSLGPDALVADAQVEALSFLAEACWPERMEEMAHQWQEVRTEALSPRGARIWAKIGLQTGRRLVQLGEHENAGQILNSIRQSQKGNEFEEELNDLAARLGKARFTRF